jgi:hypothetical protein
MSSHGRSGGALIRPQHRSLISNKNHNCNAKLRDADLAVAKPSARPTGVYRSEGQIQRHVVFPAECEEGFRGAKHCLGIAALNFKDTFEVVDESNCWSMVGLNGMRARLFDQLPRLRQRSASAPCRSTFPWRSRRNWNWRNGEAARTSHHARRGRHRKARLRASRDVLLPISVLLGSKIPGHFS